MLPILGFLYPLPRGGLCWAEAPLRQKGPKEVGLLIPAAPVSRRWGPSGRQGGPAADPGWHLGFCCGEAAEASSAQSLVLPAAVVIETVLSPGPGLPSATVSEPEAEMRRGLSLWPSQGDSEVRPVLPEAARAAALPLLPLPARALVRGCK